VLLKNVNTSKANRMSMCFAKCDTYHRCLEHITSWKTPVFFYIFVIQVAEGRFSETSDQAHGSARGI